MRSEHQKAPAAGQPRDGQLAPAFLGLAFLGLAFLALAFLALGCGGGIEDADATLATLRPVRGAVAIDGDGAAPVTRVDSTQNIVLQERSLARLELDLGARLLLGDHARLSVRDVGSVQLEGGRVFAEVQGGAPPLEVRTERGRLRLHDGSVSITIEPDALRAYVVRGELSFSASGARGVVAAGDELVLDGSLARTAPATLFDDWTGGLAEPGPVDQTRARGIGALEARVPEEVGRARWPLVVRRMDVRVRIDGDVATTEVEQVFFNPASEALEGLYRVRVPSGAVLQRFAVDREGTLVDGYVRERGQARRAYEAQVYRGSTDDPALLEWDGVDAYRARIYPIGAGETRRIVIRYAEWLRPSADRRRRLYRYPMGGGDRAPRIAELSLRVDVSNAGAAELRAALGATVEEGRVRLRRSDFVPRADFWLDLIGEAATDAAQPAWRAPHAPSAGHAAETARLESAQSGEAGEADERDYYFLPLVLPASLAGEDAPEGLDMVVVADISAATDRAQLELGRSAVEALTGLLSERDRVAIVGGDLTLRTLSADERAHALGDTTRRRIEGLLDGLARARAGGATDLGAILSEAAALLDPSRRGLVVYVGDGTPTVGERDGAALLDRVSRLPHPVRFYAIGVGADANLPLLSALTDGGGLALAVEERRQAADAALDLFAHAARPVAHDVRVSLGDTIANRYPRRPVDAILGDVLPVVGRIDGAPPRFVTVTGTILGEPFSTRIDLVTQESAAAADLRLRWSSARLQHLLHDGATEEEIAELGVRYGMITPYTSYYVPSARELAAAARPPAASTSPSSSASDDDMPAEERAAEPAPAAQPRSVQAVEAPPPPRSPRPARVSRRGSGAASTGAGASVQAGPVAVQGSRDAGTVAGGTSRAMSAVRACYAAALARTVGLGGSLTVRFSIGADGQVQGAALAPSAMNDAAFLGCVTRAFQSLRFPPAEGLTTVTQSISFSNAAGGPPLFLMLAQTLPLAVAAATEHARGEAHRPRSCSDASRLPLADRRELWRERLQADGARGVRAQALRECEAPTWRDRSALIDVLVSAAGSVPAMLAVYEQLDSSAERAHARALVLRRVRTAQDLRAVRHAFSEADALDWTLVEQILERAPSATHRLRALRRLSAEFPRSFELKLRLLEALEAEARLPEARRLADRMRRDPLADAGVRAAIGEMLLRHGQREEARRALSEIVELAPLDELARRRLGDLYRAHGWFEEAYRQYETLRELRPDDPSVLLLLAQAAGGAGRVDEALRLEASLSQTEAPGSARGLARTALLWSSVRFARLRSATDDPARLARLRRRMARSGVLGSRVALRIALTFAHPDAQLSLFTAHPGGPLARPADLAPGHGIEVFDVEEPEPGAYRVEVRRSGNLRSSAEAELCVLLDEGGPDEAVILLPLRFRAGESVLAWTLEDGRLTSVGPAR